MLRDWELIFFLCLSDFNNIYVIHIIQISDGNQTNFVVTVEGVESKSLKVIYDTIELKIPFNSLIFVKLLGSIIHLS